MTDTPKPPREAALDRYEQPFFAELSRIGQAIGYGRSQQILGELWDAAHGCAPRGSMGVTVRDAQPPQAAQPEAEREAHPVAWLIEFLAQGQPHRNAALHNAVADYRHLDPNARSTPLYALAAPAQPEAPRGLVDCGECRTNDCSAGKCRNTAPGQPEAQELPAPIDDAAFIAFYGSLPKDNARRAADVLTGWRTAIAQERERCAKVCESFIDGRGQARAALAAARALKEGDEREMIDRLSHESTVNLYNRTLQRAADAIRAAQAAKAGEALTDAQIVAILHDWPVRENDHADAIDFARAVIAAAIKADSQRDSK